MRNLAIFSVLLLLVMSFVSAELILTEQPTGIYNLGDTIPVPAVVKTVAGVSGSLDMDLICNGVVINFYKNGVFLLPGEEKDFDASIFLAKQIIGNISGFCSVKATVGDEYVLTNDFEISNKILLDIRTEENEFSPEESILLEGEAIKANGEFANGFIDLSMQSDNSTENVTYYETVNNGFFSFSFSLPKDTRAGRNTLTFNTYEKDVFGEITNVGSMERIIIVRQISTSLEIIFESKYIEPGNSLNVKVVLHDQTGEKIPSRAIITIRNSYNDIIEQLEIPTDEFFEFPISYNEPAEEWTVIAVSDTITTELPFEINEKEDAEIEIFNKTLFVTNKGNVPYNETLLLKIGDVSLNIDVFLEVDESSKYVLSAPDGEYEIEIIENGESEFTQTVFLTGKVISIKEVSGVLTLMKYPLIWIFIIFILAFVAFMVGKKGYQGTFIGYISKKVKKQDGSNDSTTARKQPVMKKDFLLRSKYKGELSLNLRGAHKQSASIVCVKIKNLRNLIRDDSIEDTLQEIINFGEDYKAVPYTHDHYDNLMLILVPAMTKTFKNERAAITIAQKAKEIIERHNKMSNQKLDFGISVNYGDLAAKKENDILRFMGFGSLISDSKKISTASEGEILLSENLKNRLTQDIKVDKQHKNGIDVYILKEVRSDAPKKRKFISEFIKRLERGKSDNKKDEEKKEDKPVEDKLESEKR